MERGEAAQAILQAAALGRDFGAAGVPDTQANRDLFAQIAIEIAQAPPGTVVEIPWDYVSGEEPPP